MRNKNSFTQMEVVDLYTLPSIIEKLRERDVIIKIQNDYPVNTFRLQIYGDLPSEWVEDGLDWISQFGEDACGPNFQEIKNQWEREYGE